MNRRSRNEIASLMEEFEEIRADMLELVDHSADLLADIPPRHQRSARNLLCYLALRSRDLRPLQARLAAAGLSSLGRAESHVLAAVNAVLLVLQRLAGPRRVPVPPQPVDFAEGQSLLDVNTEAVLGLRPAGRGVAIMVTMPSEAAEDYMLVDQLLHQAMDCVRINCGARLGSEKGINLPDTALRLPALTDKDRAVQEEILWFCEAGDRKASGPRTSARCRALDAAPRFPVEAYRPSTTPTRR